MRKSDQLAEVIAAIDVLNEEFSSLEDSCEVDEGGRLVYPITAVADVMGFDVSDSKFQRAANKAKITVRKNGKQIGEHFIDGSLFERDGEICVTVYAAMLIVMSGSSETSDLVAKAHDYFASKVDLRLMEDEKRLRNRFDVVEENKRLHTTARASGVKNFGYFNGAGYRGLYGGLGLDQVAAKKGLKRGSDLLDFAGAEELAANLFRITQTNAVLSRKGIINERQACRTHEKVGSEVRGAIKRVGGVMPEDLPASGKRIDSVITETSQRLEK